LRGINIAILPTKLLITNIKEVTVMEVFGQLFNDLTGWLTIGIIGFVFVMMAYLISMFVSKSSDDGK
jgi:hypothetical protein